LEKPLLQGCWWNDTLTVLHAFLKSTPQCERGYDFTHPQNNAITQRRRKYLGNFLYWARPLEITYHVLENFGRIFGMYIKAYSIQFTHGAHF
jgi:hypothetical protein